MRKLQQGVTLIELAIVMIIASILGISAVLLWPNETRLHVTAQAQQLTNQIRYMQHYAATRHTALRVNFSSSQYSFTELDGTTAITDPSNNASTVTMPSGITLSTSNLPNSYIVFDSNGIPYINASLATALAVSATITLSGTGVTGTISISPQSGAVSKAVIS